MEKHPDDFLFRFHTVVRDQSGFNKNMVISPYGASCLGEMLALGATGETKTTLQTLFVPTGQTSKRTTWFRLPKEKDGELPFVSANGMWVQKEFPIRSDYKEMLSSLFDPEINNVDFKKDAVGECTKINTWIANSTENRITKLFETLDSQSQLILVNALSFQGKWAIPFDKNATKRGTFHCSNEEKKEVLFMQNTLRLNYAKTDLYQAVAVPYEKNICSLIVVLPNETESLDAVEKSLNEDAITKMIDKMVLERIEFILPTFEIESEIDLNSALSRMGAKIIFDSQKADFSGISETQGLYVDRMVQKIFLRVDESGTEAVAGTGAVIAPKSISIKEIDPLIFRTDRPFLFLIRDNTTGVPLFIGRFVGR